MELEVKTIAKIFALSDADEITVGLFMMKGTCDLTVENLI